MAQSHRGKHKGGATLTYKIPRLPLVPVQFSSMLPGLIVMEKVVKIIIFKVESSCLCYCISQISPL